VKAFPCTSESRWGREVDKRENMLAQFFSLLLRVLAVAVLVVVSSSNHCRRYFRNTSRNKKKTNNKHAVMFLEYSSKHHTHAPDHFLSYARTQIVLSHIHTPTYTLYTHSNIHAFGTGALHVGGLGCSTTCGWIGRVGRSDTLIPPVLVLRESASCQSYIYYCMRLTIYVCMHCRSNHNRQHSLFQSPHPTVAIPRRQEKND